MKTDLLKAQAIIPVLVLINFCSGAAAQERCPDFNGQDRQAFQYLNQIRSAPAPYALRNGFSRNQLTPALPLHWNPQLAQLARQKAQSMARYDYFAHIEPNGLGPNRRLVQSGYRLPSDYPLDAHANTVESLAAGAPSANEAMDQLLIDRGVPGAEHRVHLLAAASLFRTHTEVGIGIACNPTSTYMFYYVVLTAPALPGVADIHRQSGWRDRRRRNALGLSALRQTPAPKHHPSNSLRHRSRRCRAQERTAGHSRLRGVQRSDRAVFPTMLLRLPRSCRARCCQGDRQKSRCSLRVLLKHRGSASTACTRCASCETFTPNSLGKEV